MPPNPQDPCARAGRDVCGTAGTGFYHGSRYGTRWFGDYRGVVPGHPHAFCIDLRYWYAAPSYRYRVVASSGLRNRAGASVSAEKQAKLAYAIWAFGRSTTPSRQAAVMLYVHSLMGDARPGELDPDAVRPSVAAFYERIGRAAARYHGPYRIEASLPRGLAVGRPATATLRVLSATGAALPGQAFSLSVTGADAPSLVSADAAGRADVVLTPTAVDVKVRVSAAGLASSTPTIYAPTTTAAAPNGQRLAVGDGARVTAEIARTATAAVTSAVSHRVVRRGASIFDRVRVAGLGGGTASVDLALFGPFPSQAAVRCEGRPHWRGRLAVGPGGATRSPPVAVKRPGFYAYRERLLAGRGIAAVETRCGVAAETALVAPWIVTGQGDAAAPVRAPAAGASTPVRLRIPALRIGARIFPAGIDMARGVLGVPADIHRIGWWRDGMAPGAGSGSILIAGHVDSARAGRGALFALPRARAGQRVHVTTADGAVHTYRVVSVRSYPKRALPLGVYAKDGPPRLVLVTCGGTFDPSTGHYPDDVVVTAVPV
ncbi:MAG TPA: class F sortase [Gaiellaceae bacterium]